MPLKTFTANGYEDFQIKLEEIKSGRIVVLFTGSKLLTTGQSWCPDCVRAEPVVEKVVERKEIKEIDVNFIIVFVGNREIWKDPACAFRTDPKLKLSCIPTLLEYGNKGKRLIDDQVANENLVSDLFQAED